MGAELAAMLPSDGVVVRGRLGVCYKKFHLEALLIFQCFFGMSPGSGVTTDSVRRAATGWTRRPSQNMSVSNSPDNT